MTCCPTDGQSCMRISTILIDGQLAFGDWSQVIDDGVTSVSIDPMILTI